jgi:hypothetical protein
VIRGITGLPGFWKDAGRQGIFSWERGSPRPHGGRMPALLLPPIGMVGINVTFYIVPDLGTLALTVRVLISIIHT